MSICEVLALTNADPRSENAYSTRAAVMTLPSHAGMSIGPGSGTRTKPSELV